MLTNIDKCWYIIFINEWIYQKCQQIHLSLHMTNSEFIVDWLKTTFPVGGWGVGWSGGCGRVKWPAELEIDWAGQNFDLLEFIHTTQTVLDIPGSKNLVWIKTFLQPVFCYARGGKQSLAELFYQD